MGAQYSQFDSKSIKPFIDSLFKQTLLSRQHKMRRDYMVLSDLIVSLKETFVADNREEYLIHFNHIALLYVLDTDKVGRFYQQDFYNFADEIITKVMQPCVKSQKSHLVAEHVRAYCI